MIGTPSEPERTGSRPVVDPHGTADGPGPVDVLSLSHDLGVALGHRIVVLSLERWRDWADLRFARFDVEGTHRLTRRVPPDDGWKVAWQVDLSRPPTSVAVLEVVGRGGRGFSNGEVRLEAPVGSMSLRHGFLNVEVTLAPGAPALSLTIDLAGAQAVDVTP